jgi:hypothetical protein
VDRTKKCLLGLLNLAIKNIDWQISKWMVDSLQPRIAVLFAGSFAHRLATQAEQPVIHRFATQALGLASVRIDGSSFYFLSPCLLRLGGEDEELEVEPEVIAGTAG